MTGGLLIFALTYVLISVRRLDWLGFDRPAGALLGAIACVVFGVLTPQQALAAIDGSTLLLLFGVMGLGAFLALDGFFVAVEARAARWAAQPRRLLGAIVWGSGLLAALITNDAVCLLAAPLVVALVQRHGLPPLPFLLALASGANTGSVATLVGNPQNMLCASLGGLSFRRYLARVGPLALVSLALNHALLRWAFRRELVPATPSPRAVTAKATAPRATPTATPTAPAWRSALTLGVIGATALAYLLGANLAFAATAGFVAAMLLHRRDARQLWARIDWSLLLFFAGLFVVVEGLQQSGAPAALFARYPLSAQGPGLAGWLRLAGIFLVGSNIVSNVPFILVVRPQLALLAQPALGWELLAVASTFAGNLALLGSVANIIVAESAREVGGIGFGQHLRIGLPLALLTTLLGTTWLVALGP